MNVFIANKEIKDISPTVIESIKNGEEWILNNIAMSNAYINSKTSYILKNGTPISYIRRLVR
ncbi:MAG: hypothetical protein II244_01555 [Clostridia bacterium]|nr:hypothetical protein [Clostridia bacterium]